MNEHRITDAPLNITVVKSSTVCRRSFRCRDHCRRRRHRRRPIPFPHFHRLLFLVYVSPFVFVPREEQTASTIKLLDPNISKTRIKKLYRGIRYQQPHSE